LHSAQHSAILFIPNRQLTAVLIPQEFIDEVLSRVDIVEFIEPRVAIKKTGKDYTGLCPFHDEKSPSFSVSQDKQFYYCFGCQVQGNVLKFLLEYERMDFVSAVELLAARAGMEIPKQEERGSDERYKLQRTMYEVLEKAAVFYREQLKDHKQRDHAVGYLKGRGLSGEVARDFGIGFAPAGWDNLLTALATTNYDRELLIQSGMVIDKTEDDRTYDRFRDRIMFPIRDLRGRTIAFGGRIIGDGKPKYLNSPETPVFHKGRELYGLYEARRQTKSLSQVVVVEGYMDVVALAQHGINYSVATLGTATTPDHIDRLYRLVSRIVFSFDGDEAGRKAAWKALLTVLEFLQDGRSAAFLFLPDGEDPDSLVRKDGSEKFELRLSRATSFTEFFFAHLEAPFDVQTMEGKAALSKAAMPLIQKIPEGVFRQLMIDELSARTGLSSERLLSVSAEYAAAAPGYSQAGPTNERDEAESAMPFAGKQVEQAISMLLLQPELALELDADSREMLKNDAECTLLSHLVEMVSTTTNASPIAILSAYHGKAEFEYLKSLAEREQLLDVSQFSGEFCGIVKTRLAKASFDKARQQLQSVLAKPLAELSDEERQQVRAYYRHKS
jgi:DNA primase